MRTKNYYVSAELCRNTIKDKAAKKLFTMLFLALFGHAAMADSQLPETLTCTIDSNGDTIKFMLKNVEKISFSHNERSYMISKNFKKDGEEEQKNVFLETLEYVGKDSASGKLRDFKTIKEVEKADQPSLTQMSLSSSKAVIFSLNFIKLGIPAKGQDFLVEASGTYTQADTNIVLRWKLVKNYPDYTYSNGVDFSDYRLLYDGSNKNKIDDKKWSISYDGLNFMSANCASKFGEVSNSNTEEK